MLTPLWILPYVLCGLIVGYWAKKRDFSLSGRERISAVVLAELVVTVLNTGVLYLDSKLMGYWFPGFISGMLTLRLVVCVVKAVVFALVLPSLAQAATWPSGAGDRPTDRSFSGMCRRPSGRRRFFAPVPEKSGGVSACG